MQKNLKETLCYTVVSKRNFNWLKVTYFKLKRFFAVLHGLDSSTKTKDDDSSHKSYSIKRRSTQKTIKKYKNL